MAREVYFFLVTIPAGTSKNAPATTNLVMPERVVRRIEVTVPPGPRGQVGFIFAHAGTSMIPINSSTVPGVPQAFVTDNEKISWDLDDYITTGAWQLVGFNTGKFDHTLYIRFHVDLVPWPAQFVGFQPIPNDALASV